MRYPLVMGNWKLNGNKHIVNQLLFELCDKLSNTRGCTVAIAPPILYLDQAKKMIEDNSQLFLGAQNVDINLSGAFTGEVSANMLKDIGVKYVIIGHSERRYYHLESNNLIAKKFSILKKVGLIPILCIGETAEENAAGKTEKICSQQIDAIINTQGVNAFKQVVIAYEPIWAIGTGKSATPQHAQNIHNFIRKYIATRSSPTIANQVIIQYGGSVNEKNAAELFAQPDIDGALVGSASLKVETFTKIVKAAILEKVKNNI